MFFFGTKLNICANIIKLKYKINVLKMVNKKIKNISASQSAERLVNAYNKKSSAKWIVVCVVIFCIIFSIVFLYQPAKNFYLSIREQDRLQAQLNIIKQTNANLTNDIETLQSDEGIRQKATESLGLVQQGESIGYVNGLNDESANANSASSTSSKLAYKNIKPPKTWYSPFCNFIFNIYE